MPQDSDCLPAQRDLARYLAPVIGILWCGSPALGAGSIQGLAGVYGGTIIVGISAHLIDCFEMVMDHVRFEVDRKLTEAQEVLKALLAVSWPATCPPPRGPPPALPGLLLAGLPPLAGSHVFCQCIACPFHDGHACEGETTVGGGSATPPFPFYLPLLINKEMVVSLVTFTLLSSIFPDTLRMSLL
jgi:hypothetical protein